MRTAGWFVAVLALTAAAAASAADLNVRIADDHGKAVADAVVTVLPEGDPTGDRPAPQTEPRRHDRSPAGCSLGNPQGTAFSCWHDVL